MITRLLLAAFVLVTFSNCQYHVRKFAAENPPAGTQSQWPPAQYDEVRAYCYDFQADISRSFLHHDRMHAGVMDPKGIKMSADQIDRLVKSVSISQPKSARTPCYAPHHAFVFYSKGAPVAVFEMCFGCNQFKGYPGAGLPEYVNTPELYRICQELNLPLGTGNKFYADAVKAYRQANPQ